MPCKFKVGDWVKVIDATHEGFISSVEKDIIGKVGKIIEVGDICVGVEFTEYVDGHSCEGRGKIGYCRYLLEDEIKKITKKEAMLHAL